MMIFYSLMTNAFTTAQRNKSTFTFSSFVAKR